MASSSLWPMRRSRISSAPASASKRQCLPPPRWEWQAASRRHPRRVARLPRRIQLDPLLRRGPVPRTRRPLAVLHRVLGQDEGLPLAPQDLHQGRDVERLGGLDQRVVAASSGEPNRRCCRARGVRATRLCRRHPARGADRDCPSPGHLRRPPAAPRHPTAPQPMLDVPRELLERALDPAIPARSAAECAVAPGPAIPRDASAADRIASAGPAAPAEDRSLTPGTTLSLTTARGPVARAGAALALPAAGGPVAGPGPSLLGPRVDPPNLSAVRWSP